MQPHKPNWIRAMKTPCGKPAVGGDVLTLRKTAHASARSIKEPAHSARHRIPKGRKGAKLILVRKDAPYYQSIVRLKDRKTDSDWRWHEGSEAIWVPRNWIDDDAVEYARGWLAVEIVSWAEQDGAKILGLKRSKREDEFRAAIAVLKCIQKNLTADNLPLIESLLDRAIPALERAKRANQHGGHTDLHLPRYRLIAQTVDIICRRYGYRPTRAFLIVAEALRRDKAIPNSKESVGRIWRNRRTTFENQVN